MLGMETTFTPQKPKPTSGRRLGSAVTLFVVGFLLGLPLYGLLEQLANLGNFFGAIEKIACLGADGLSCILYAPIFFGIVFGIVGFFVLMNRKVQKVLWIILVLLAPIIFFVFY